MESRDSQRDKRIRQVLRGSGSDSADVMRAREEIQSIEAERQNNLNQQRAFMQGRQQQMATMRQAAMIGAGGMVGGAGGGPQLQRQVGGMNPQTQAMLQKYGIKPGQRSSNNSNSQRSVQNSSQGPNVRTTTNNTTNNNTRNEIRIVQPQIPMRQQAPAAAAAGGSGGAGGMGGLNKFKAWLDSAFAKQNTEYEVQQKEFRKKDWNLARASSKLFEKLSNSTKSLGEKMDPKNMGSTFGGQMQTMLFIFLTTVIAKWWKPIMRTIANIECGIKSIFGIPINADLQKAGATGFSFVDKIKSFVGIDTKSAKGKATSLLEGIRGAFSDGIDRLIKTLKLFVEDRRIALQKINMPQFKLPSTDGGGGIMGSITEALGGTMRSIMAPATEYLGNIFTAIMGGSHALAGRAASNMYKSATTQFKHSYGGHYITSNSYNAAGVLRSDSTYGMSQLMMNDLNDRSGTLHVGSIATGFKQLESSANANGYVILPLAFFEQMGLGHAVMPLLKSGKMKQVQMKQIEVSKTDAEHEEYSGGTWGEYVGDEILGDLTFGLIGGKMGKRLASTKGAKKLGKAAINKMALKSGANIAKKAVGKLGVIGAVAGVGMSVGSGVSNYMEANKGYSNTVTKIVPLNDPRPGRIVTMFQLSKEGFQMLKQFANIKSFGADDPTFMSWVEKIARNKKAANHVTGRLTYDNPTAVQAVKEGNIRAANYDHQKAAIWNAPGRDKDAVNNIRSGLSNLAYGASNLAYGAASFFNGGSITMAGGGCGIISANMIHYILCNEGWTGGTPREDYHCWKNPATAKQQSIDAHGVITVGPGLTNMADKRISAGRRFSGLEVVALFQGVINNFSNTIQRNYPNVVKLGQGAIDAVFAYMYNCGGKNAFRSVKSKEELANVLRGGPTTAGGKYLKPLEERRAAEAGIVLGQNVNRFTQVYYSKPDKDCLDIIAAMGGKIPNDLKNENSSGAGEQSATPDGAFQTGSNSSSSSNAEFEGDANENIKTSYQSSYAYSGTGAYNYSQLTATENVTRTLNGSEKIDDNLKIGDWQVGKSANWLMSHGHAKSTGACAKYVRQALAQGGLSAFADNNKHPYAATGYATFFPKVGFPRIENPGNSPQVGDISVTIAGPQHQYGHICMWCGRNWISDFVQNRSFVYHGGSGPEVFFRYSGKGAGGGAAVSSDWSESIVPTSSGSSVSGEVSGGGFLSGVGNTIGDMASKAGDMMANAAGKLGSSLSSLGNLLNPNSDSHMTNGKFDESKLNASQKLMLKYFKASVKGLKMDDQGIYVDDKSGGKTIRHYFDENSDISDTGNITTSNIKGTAEVDKNGRITRMLSGREAEAEETNYIQDILSSKLAGGAGGAAVKVDIFLGAFTDIDTFSQAAQNFYNRYCGGEIMFNLYEASANFDKMYSVLTLEVPAFDPDTGKLVSGTNWNSDLEFKRNKESLYKSGERGKFSLKGQNRIMDTINPKKGWMYLYSERGFHIHDWLKGPKAFKVVKTPVLFKSTGVKLTYQAEEKIKMILKVVRGEASADEIKELGLTSKDLKKLTDKSKDFKELGNKTKNEVLGINNDSINKSIRDYKSGKNKNNFYNDNGTIIDKSLGVSIGTVDKNGDFTNFRLADIENQTASQIQNNKRLVDYASGKIDIKYSTGFEHAYSLANAGIYQKNNKKAAQSFMDLRKGLIGQQREVNIGGIPFIEFIGPDGQPRLKVDDRKYGKFSDSISKNAKGTTLLGGQISAHDLQRALGQAGMGGKGMSKNDLLNALTNFKGPSDNTNTAISGLINSLRSAKLMGTIDYGKGTSGLYDQFMRMGAGASDMFGNAKRYAGEAAIYNDNSRFMQADIDSYNSGENRAGLYEKNGLLYKPNGDGTETIVGKAGTKTTGKGKNAKTVKSGSLLGKEQYAKLNSKKPKSLAELRNWMITKFGAEDTGTGDGMIVKTGDKKKGIVISLSSIGNNVPNNIDELAKLPGATFVAAKGSSIFNDNLGDDEASISKNTGGALSSGDLENWELDATANSAKYQWKNGIKKSMDLSAWDGTIGSKNLSKEDLKRNWIKAEKDNLAMKANSIINNESSSSEDKSAALLGNIEDYSAQEVDLLAIIAKNSAKDGKLEKEDDDKVKAALNRTKTSREAVIDEKRGKQAAYNNAYKSVLASLTKKRSETLKTAKQAADNLKSAKESKDENAISAAQEEYNQNGSYIINAPIEGFNQSVYYNVQTGHSWGGAHPGSGVNPNGTLKGK